MQLPAIEPTISNPPLASHYRHPSPAPQPLLNVSFWFLFVFATCANVGSPEELVAAMAVLPESTSHALRLLNMHQSCRRHEYIKFNERCRIEEMGLEALSDGKDGSGTAGEE